MNTPFTLTRDDVGDAISAAIEMALAFERQRLSPIDAARADLALGEHASPEVQAACQVALEHVADAVAVAAGVMLAAAGAQALHQ